ncbi:MAG: hypothetical protein WA984_19265, partial [Phormidesmis sp.]
MTKNEMEKQVRLISTVPNGTICPVSNVSQRMVMKQNSHNFIISIVRVLHELCLHRLFVFFAVTYGCYRLLSHRWQNWP